ncbi:MarR family transcriptional regulator [Actinoallomurus purpureus]|uniref:MarR family winged helix-turn-helix transcriptional regulator n=1 Tax=Actinoallomurus purpureus TaxID=478114 RepID=UPI0020928902|nr:MarR family transcriptional regulator [Actinoallomurus purpureus]MCO6009762.1 MarR family transcriptional regulator [Actinoallomurus purpureus]
MTDRGVLATASDESADLFGDFVDAVLDLLRAARRTGGAANTVQGDAISVPQLVVLGAIDVVGDRGVSAVAEQAGLAQPTVTRALTALERRGMVTRTPHARDGRSTCIALTAAGRAVLEEKRQEIVGRFAEIWQDLAAGEREHAVSLVRRLSAVTDRLV